MVGTTAKPMRSRASSRSMAMSSTSAAMRGRTLSRLTSASKPARMLAPPRDPATPWVAHAIAEQPVSLVGPPMKKRRNRTGVTLNGVSRRRSRRYATKSVAMAAFGWGLHRSGSRSRMPSSAVLSMRSSTSAR